MTAFLWLSEAEAEALHHVLEGALKARVMLLPYGRSRTVADELRALAIVEPIMLRLGDMLAARGTPTEAAGVPPRLGGAGPITSAPELHPPRPDEAEAGAGEAGA